MARVSPKRKAPVLWPLPFVLALSPGTWFWQTGRYIGYVVPLYVMVLAIGACAAGRLASSRIAFADLREQISGVVSRLSFSVIGGFLAATALASFVLDPTPVLRCRPDGRSQPPIRYAFWRRQASLTGTPTTRWPTDWTS